MLKVVFIDDETLVKLGLRSMLNWEEEGVEIEGEASSGSEGLELILRTKPDLVITDIIMPEMDGIEMMQKVKENGFCPAFVFLSSYDQFELVKKAMQLGAKDYLLKLKLNSEMLHEMLDSIKEEIKKSPVKEEKARSVWETEELRKVFLKQALMREYVDTPDEKWDFWEEDKKMRILYVASNVHHLIGTKEGREKKIYLETLCNLIEDICREFFEAYCIEWEKGSFLIFLGEQQDDDRENLQFMAEAVVDMLKQYSNIQASIGISGSVTGYKNLKNAYLQARSIQDSLAVEGYGKEVFFEDRPLNYSVTEKEALQDLVYIENLETICETLNVQELEQTAGVLIKELKRGDIELDSGVLCCIRFICLLEEFLKQSWNKSYQRRDVDSYIKRLYSSDTLSEIVEVFQRYLEDVKKFFSNAGDNEQKRIVREAKEYILNHVYENISMEDMANALFISPGYLSSVFSKYEPIGAANYINKVKIIEAQKLLSSKRIKVYEAAFQLGYENAGYFAKVFKKYTGCTPKEYMERK